MTSTTDATGSAERWGPAWGRRASEWAATEEQQLPTYDEAIERLGIDAGTHVLEVGCGSGVFLRAAADRGAHVSGLDASPELLELARARVPEADLQLGDLQFLPYADDTFDVVAGFNSFFFAADMVAALREAGRVARPGGSVVIQVWGRHERCALDAIKPIARPLFPGADPSAPPPPDLSEPGLLEGIAAAAGLTPELAFDRSWPYLYENDDALVRSLLSAAGIGDAAGEREPEVGAALLDVLAPYREADGSYRLENEWHYLVARA
ncbi:MAG TPA: class I SAM-dependent methyltransferase [Gaiella sp.]|jgi:SAM-dependent methyltransferase